MAIDHRPTLHNYCEETPSMRVNYDSAVEEVLSTAAAALGYDKICVTVPHTEVVSLEVAQAQAAGDFLILVWSSPLRVAQRSIDMRSLDTLYGVSTYCRDAFFPPTGLADGRPIVSPEGIVVAEVFPERGLLYIHGDLTHTATTEELVIWRAVLGGAAEILREFSTPEKQAEMVAAREQQRIGEARAREQRRIEEARLKAEAGRKRIIDAIAARAGAEVRDCTSRIKSLAAYVNDYKAKLVENIRELAISEKKLLLLKQGEVDYTQKAEKELEALAHMHGVERTEVEGDTLMIYTEKLRCYDSKGNAYQLGRFRIELGLGNSHVRFFGLDKEFCRRSYWTEADPHPHVNGENGNPCIGNLAETIAVLTGQYELAALTSLLVNWLESCNVDDVAGKNIAHWDLIDSETGEVVEQGHQEAAHTCYDCGTGMDEDEFNVCVHCEEQVCDECCEYIEAVDGRVCRTCRDELYIWCELCDRYVLNDDATRIEDEDRYVCNACRDDSYTQCVECGEWAKTDDVVRVGETNVCQECLGNNDKYACCDDCGDWHLAEALDEDGHCEECQDEDEDEDEDDDENR